MRVESPAVGNAGVASAGTRTSHVIVFANEKGGSGKTTTAMHVIVALLKAGQRVASIDVDSRQRSLSRYIANRRSWAKKIGVKLELPDHHAVDRASGRNMDENDAAEFAAFATAVTSVEQTHDFVVIDTPATDSHLMRLAHAMADTLVTPLNDSFVDFDVLARIDPESYEVTAVNHYADVVTEARRQRRIIEEAVADWIVVRNRVGQFETKNGRQVMEGLEMLGRKLGFRLSEGFSERVIYRELFPRGLTVLDALEQPALGQKSSLSHSAARQEVKILIDSLRLPIDERGRRRAAARAEWFKNAGEPLDDPEFLEKGPST
jgi:chromosome partitioning protein